MDRLTSGRCISECFAANAVALAAADGASQLLLLPPLLLLLHACMCFATVSSNNRQLQLKCANWYTWGGVASHNGQAALHPPLPCSTHVFPLPSPLRLGLWVACMASQRSTTRVDRAIITSWCGGVTSGRRSSNSSAMIEPPALQQLDHVQLLTAEVLLDD